LKQLAFLAGPRRVWRSGSLSPFAQFLVGVARSTTSLPEGGLSDSTTDWGIAPGAGMDYRLSHHWGARGQARLLFLRGDGPGIRTWAWPSE
jgi:hypothetical protein